MSKKEILLDCSIIVMTGIICVLLLALASVKENDDEAIAAVSEETTKENKTEADDVQYAAADISYTHKSIDYEDAYIAVLRVNTATQTVSAYTSADSLIRAFQCSTGDDTPLGEFGLGEKYEWLALYDDCYGQYAYRLVGDESVEHILFHSVPYYEQSKDALEWEEYNLLGEPVSAGCIRVSAAAALWIYKNADTATSVAIYDDPDEEVSAEEACFIPECLEELRGWDPTDPDEENPWIEYSFTLDVLSVIYIDSCNDTADCITAVDCLGNDLSDYVVIECSDKAYYSSAPGAYTVNVSLSAGLLTASGTVTAIIE